MRVRRRAKECPTPISVALRSFFLTGSYDEAICAARASGEADAGGFRGLTELLLDCEKHEQRWREYAEDLVGEWIIERAGSRPWA